MNVLAILQVHQRKVDNKYAPAQGRHAAPDDRNDRRFKRWVRRGGISALVADAGLTNGAFYGHFASKDALIATVVAEQLAAQVAAVEALPPGLPSVEAFVREYLSPEHRYDPGNGCPSAALLDEISRQDVATRQAYTDGARALIGAIERHVDWHCRRTWPRDRPVHAAGLTLQLARAVTDPDTVRPGPRSGLPERDEPGWRFRGPVLHTHPGVRMKALHRRSLRP